MADSIGSMSRSMLGIVDLDGTNTDCPQLRWKTTKGKRSRKSVTRIGSSKLASETPKTVGEFSGSDTDKFDEPSLADGLECVPIKKRRHLLRSPSLSRNIEQLPLQQGIPSSHSENFEHLSDNNGLSCNQSSDLHPDLQRLASVLVNNSYDGFVGNNMVSRDDTVNLSGIALLATAACFSSIDDDPDNVKQDVTEESPTLRKCLDTYSVATPVDEPIQERLDPGHEEKCSSFAEDSSGHILVKNNQGTESICVSPKSVSPKVDRFCWDLNKVMEEWEIPQEDLVVGKNLVCEASVEERCSVQPDSIHNGNHTSMASADVATASFTLKVGNDTHAVVAIDQVHDNDEHVGFTLLKNYEQQTGLTEVARLDMKDVEEDLQKTSELSEVRTILVEDLVRKTCKTMDVVGISTSDISIADQPVVCGVGTCQDEKAIVTDTMYTSDTSSDHRGLLVSRGEIVKTLISQDSMKTLVDDDCHKVSVFEDDDDHGISDATQNISEPQLDYDSPYEDGELRVPAFNSCDRNEIGDGEEYECVDYESDGIVVGGGEESDPGDYPGSEIVEEAGSESSQAPEKKYFKPVKMYSSLNFKKVMEENNMKFKPEAKRHSTQWRGTTTDVPLVQDNNDSMSRKHNFDLADIINSGGSYPGEIGLTREKSQLCVEGGSSPLNISVSYRLSKFGDSFSRSERNRGADRSVRRCGSSSFNGRRQIGGYSHWNYKDFSNHRYECRGTEDNWQNRTRNAPTDYNTDKLDDMNSYDEHDHHQPSKGIQRSFFKRRSSPVERDGDQREWRFTHAGAYDNDNKRGSFGKLCVGFGRGRREEYDADDCASGERRYSPSSQVSGPSWKSRSGSRSRTRSPHVWQTQRERNLNNRRLTKSPERRTRDPFQKRNFNDRPTRNNDKKNSRNRRPPPVGVFTQSQRSDEHLIRPGGCMAGDRVEGSDGKHDEQFGMLDRNVKHIGTRDISRRPRHSDDNCENEGMNLSSFADTERNLDNRYRNSSPGMLRQAQKPKQNDYFRCINRPGRFSEWGNNGGRRREKYGMINAPHLGPYRETESVFISEDNQSKLTNKRSWSYGR